MAILTARLEQAIKWAWINDNPAKGATAPGRHKPERSALPLPAVAKMITALQHLGRMGRMGTW
jgi:hypothetical protein